MFIAMNRFRVIKNATLDFEQVWLTRESYLNQVSGFVEFHMLRGPEREDHVLYASHTVWASRTDFEAWTRSAPARGGPFGRAHARAPQNRPLTLGHPEFEGFEVIQTVDRVRAAAE